MCQNSQIAHGPLDSPGLRPQSLAARGCESETPAVSVVSDANGSAAQASTAPLGLCPDAVIHGSEHVLTDSPGLCQQSLAALGCEADIPDVSFAQASNVPFSPCPAAVVQRSTIAALASPGLCQKEASDVPEVLGDAHAEVQLEPTELKKSANQAGKGSKTGRVRMRLQTDTYYDDYLH